MAIAKKSDQLLYVGRGPLDAKLTKKTYAELFKEATWTTQLNGDEAFCAYNGMIVTVWFDRDTDKNFTDKNGVYLFYDKTIKTALTKPDVTKEENWHKIANVDGSAIDTKNSIYYGDFEFIDEE
jgi:hypothetical protein